MQNKTKKYTMQIKDYPIIYEALLRQAQLNDTTVWKTIISYLLESQRFMGELNAWRMYKKVLDIE